MQGPHPFLRRAGLLELFHITRCELGFDSCVIVSAQYQGTVPLTKQVVYAALKRVIARQPALSVQIDTSGKPAFVRLPSISLSEVVEIVPEPQPLDQLFAKHGGILLEMNSPIPLWRLIILPDNTVVFAYNHSIADGQSGLSFHYSFLAALNDLPDPIGDTEETVTVPSDLKLLPPVDKLTNVSMGVGKFFHTIYDSLAPTCITPAASAWTGNPVIKDISLKAVVRLWLISPSDMQAFLKVCREHKTTLTGALHTLSVIILSRLLATTENTRKYKTLSSSVAISLRRYTGTAPDVMCDQVSTDHRYIPVIRLPPSKDPKESFPWAQAAAYTRSLHKNMKKTRRTIGTAKFFVVLGMAHQYFLDQLGKKRDLGVEISNLGPFRAEEGKGKEHDKAENGDSVQRWQVDNVQFVQFDPICGAALHLSVVGSPSGALAIGFTWGEGALDDAMGDAFIDAFKAEFYSILA